MFGGESGDPMEGYQPVLEWIGYTYFWTNFSVNITAFQLKADHLWTWAFSSAHLTFCSCDLDHDLMTFTYAIELYILKIYLCTKNEVSRSKLSNVRAQTRHTEYRYTQTDATERITTPHSSVVKVSVLPVVWQCEQSVDNAESSEVSGSDVSDVVQVEPQQSQQQLVTWSSITVQPRRTSFKRLMQLCSDLIICIGFLVVRQQQIDCGL